MESAAVLQRDVRRPHNTGKDIHGNTTFLETAKLMVYWFQVTIQEGSNYTEVISIHWLTSSGVQAVQCLVSGITHLQDTTTSTAKDCFENGLSAIAGK